MMKIVKYIFVFFLVSALFSEEINGNGTTGANFLELDIGSAATSMGGAYVSVANDVSSAYWNPAGLAYVNNRQTMFMYQPWVVGINNIYAGVAINYYSYGTLALTMNYMDYGDEAVTTVANPEGTGEYYSASEFAATISYARRIVNWFSFGASAKYISSNIWHMNANAMAFDLGVLVTTDFFSVTGKRNQGMKIGMSISNYGTKLRYDGMDLMVPIDPNPDEYGNFDDVEGLYKTSEWELPLIFRLGFSVQPIYTNQFKMLLAMDALHPNNNNESINLGTQFTYTYPGRMSLFLRAGYKGLFMKDSEYGLTYGGGIRYYFTDFNFFDIDYTYKTMGMLGDVHLYTFKFSF
tara:strand:- start:247 stop:1296 length:1050 start_codon:yes stop_codon:yes gene_type:complete